MYIAVVGGRTFNDYTKLKSVLNILVNGLTSMTIVSGGANGADSLGERFANERGLQTIIHLPDWKKYGKRAGFVRNQLIIDDADIVVACWDKSSRGTENSIDLAKKANKTTILIYY